MRPLKEKVSITLDDNVVSKLRELSERDDRSLSQYINLVLKEHIKNLEEK
ncbi:MAG: TraY domain-containing protein [Hominilimicola sp.]